jgi:hypothetical protein
MSAPGHAAGAQLAGPARKGRAPTGFDITACVHEADLPRRNRVRRTRLVIVQPQDNASTDDRAGLNLIVNKP